MKYSKVRSKGGFSNLHPPPPLLRWRQQTSANNGPAGALLEIAQRNRLIRMNYRTGIAEVVSKLIRKSIAGA